MAILRFTLIIIFFSCSIALADTTSNLNPPAHHGLYHYDGMQLYRKNEIIYFYDQLKSPIVKNWDVSGAEERFSVIAVTPSGKSCQYLIDKNCNKLPLPENAKLVETFQYIGSDVQGIHHYEGFLQLVSPEGNVIRERKTHCNTLPQSTTNTSCPFDAGIEI